MRPVKSGQWNMEKTLQRRACAKTGSKNGSTVVQEETEAGRAPGNRWQRRTEGDEAALGGKDKVTERSVSHRKGVHSIPRGTGSQKRVLSRK